MFNLYSHIQSESKNKISQNYRVNEKQCVERLLNLLELPESVAEKAAVLAKDLIVKVRSSKVKGRGVDVLMQKFKLSTVEGVSLMCLAESLLRIPDQATKDKLIRDKIAKGEWSNYTKTNNIFVNAASWALLISGRLVDSYNDDKLSAVLLRILAKGGEPLIRRAMSAAVKLMGNQFVMGETINDALAARTKFKSKGYKFSFDMLGEAAMNEEDAARYMQSYIDAIIAVGKANTEHNVYTGEGISVKLSAIHSCYSRNQYHRVMSELLPRLKKLYLLAKEYQIGLFIDAEESDRLEISLELLEMLINDKDLQGFEGIGFVVQAYQKRAVDVIEHIASLAKTANTKIMLRLVKGAYWDSEIKQAQVDGQSDYPVFTRKFYTDVSYLACAKILFNHQECIYPLFATHNAHSLAVVYYMGEGKNYEFQCLYGMGEALYNNVVGDKNLNKICRVYAPVGTYDTLLAYLVRRLLENGANSSFVHQILDNNTPIEELVTSPVILAKKAQCESNPHFSRPEHIYPRNRLNSKGIDLSDEITLSKLQDELNKYEKTEYLAYPLLNSESKLADMHLRHKTDVFSPGCLSDKVGQCIKAIESDVEVAVSNAENAFISWSQLSCVQRAQILLDVADNLELEAHYIELLTILVREAGKTLPNAVNEVREAIDFCRYYANQVMHEFDNHTRKALGTFVCISPWNFPLAIFVGEVSSCLVSGNCVIAKPSYQTNLVAFYAVKLFHEAGVPKDVLQFLPGSGSVIGNLLTKHPRIKGVVFTGSTEVAQTINQNLASKDFESVLIAETGGQNAMIVDSSALPEQVVTDVISSGFDSAGQRCSALRVLYLQADIADKVLHMLRGAMGDLRVGNPTNLSTDIGPVIDKNAQKTLLEHIENMKINARMFHQSALTSDCDNGIYVPPTLIEIGSISELHSEVFGPVVHVIRFANDELDKVIQEINSTGFGLTNGLHSRIETTAAKVYKSIKAGNIYINRNMVGAVVGVQPFGGEGLSGTGPKAGGPLYLYRLVNSLINPLAKFVSADMEAGLSASVNTNLTMNAELNMYTECKYDFFKLNCFLAQLDKCGFSIVEQQELYNYAEIIRDNSLISRQIELPGPTGERNFMFFAKRGVIACFASQTMDYAKQIICALATDNDAILSDDIHANVFAKILPSGLTIVNDVQHMPIINATLIADSYSKKQDLRTELARRNGALVTNIYENHCGYYNLYLLVTERTVSINTTATGGNVELMSMKDTVVELYDKQP